MHQNPESLTQTVETQAKITAQGCPVPIAKRNKIMILFWQAIGILCVGLAILGAILPILPTTVFLIMATACFAKSSPRMQQKLLNNKTFGPLIREWQKNRSIPRKAKRIALLMIVFSVVWSSYLLEDLLLSLLVISLVIWPFIYLCRLPISK